MADETRVFSSGLLVLTLCAGVIMLAASPASAQAGRNCDAIKDDHAFNLCLASQGPRRGVRATPPAGAAPAASRSRRGAARAQSGGARLRGGMVITRTKGGRVRMIIPGRRR